MGHISATTSSDSVAYVGEVNFFNYTQYVANAYPKVYVLAIARIIQMDFIASPKNSRNL